MSGNDIGQVPDLTSTMKNVNILSLISHFMCLPFSNPLTATAAIKQKTSK